MVKLLIPVVHLDLRICLKIFEKFEMTLMLFSGAWVKMSYEKNLTQKSRDTMPSNGQFTLHSVLNIWLHITRRVIVWRRQGIEPRESKDNTTDGDYSLRNEISFYIDK